MCHSERSAFQQLSQGQYSCTQATDLLERETAELIVKNNVWMMLNVNVSRYKRRPASLSLHVGLMEYEGNRASALEPPVNNKSIKALSLRKNRVNGRSIKGRQGRPLEQ
jgi:hypothetical protein